MLAQDGAKIGPGQHIREPAGGPGKPSVRFSLYRREKLADLDRCDEVSQCQRCGHLVAAIVVSDRTVRSPVNRTGEILDFQQKVFHIDTLSVANPTLRA
ncbi:hypothetical protein [Actinophytocola sp.]|uniref:hypothetical protein n=1 Tax=Actinophytocola sp. TaxID=1872138 RepID=UPI002ED61791